MRSPDALLVVAFGAIAPLVAGGLVGLRFLARFRYAKCGVDDFLALLSLAILASMSLVLIIGAAKFGFGEHVESIVRDGYNDDLSDITTDTKHLAVVSGLMLSLGLGATKQSILFFYRRMFRGRVFNVISWLLIAACLAWTLTVFLSNVLQCGRHVENLWTSEKVIAGTCLPGTQLAEYSAGADFATDVLILVFPMYWTSKMQMAHTRKILVLVVFFFGALAVFASLARLIVTVLVYSRHNSDPDQLSFLTNVTFAQTLELGCCIVAVCLPTLGCFVSDAAKRRINGLLRWMLPPALRTSTPCSLKQIDATTGDNTKALPIVPQDFAMLVDGTSRGNGRLVHGHHTEFGLEEDDLHTTKIVLITQKSAVSAARPF